MASVLPRVCVGEPASFTGPEIDDFVALVLAGGEVAAKGLRGRVTNAAHIAYARKNECLLGVAGLKKPSDGHRSEIEKGAGMKLSAESWPLELGWVFVLPSARGRRLAAALCRPLVSLAEGKGIFATSRTDNATMHRTLAKLGFKRVGKEWASKENDAELALFVRNADKQLVAANRER